MHTLKVKKKYNIKIFFMLVLKIWILQNPPILQKRNQHILK